MNDEKAFAEALRRHGRLVRPHELHANQSKGLAEQLEFYRLVAPYVYCGFLDNQGFNAVATIHNSREFIGIYLGATILVARYAYCLLSDPKMLPQIGDPSVESIEPRVIEDLRNPLGPVGTDRYLPRDPIRLRAAQRLAMGAYMILFFHELGHIELCHLAFIRDQLGSTDYQEVTAAPLSEQEALLLRALEWDADNAALMSSLKMWRSFCSSLDYSAVGALGPARSWCLAAQLLFWVMDFVQPPNRRGLLATHPSPKARLVNARMVATSFGFVPDLSDTEDADSLVSWIFRNKFPSHMIERVAGGSSVDKTPQELVEARGQYEKIMPLLEHYQTLRPNGGPILHQ